MWENAKRLRMITRNDHKFQEARELLQEFGIDLIQVRSERAEIQSDDIEEIAAYSAQQAAKSVEGPLIAEDAGLAIEALNGFPGPYSSFVLDRIGLRGIVKLMEGVENRCAEFRSAVAFADTPAGQPVVFAGAVKGYISEQPRGKGGFGYDPLFVPSQGDGRTFAEMTTDEKNRISHRSMAMRRFGQWFQHQTAIRSTNARHTPLR